LDLWKWCWRRDSNSQPPDYKSGALPIEPRQHLIVELDQMPQYPEILPLMQAFFSRADKFCNFA